jgi:hypothetical protein
MESGSQSGAPEFDEVDNMYISNSEITANLIPAEAEPEFEFEFEW